MRIKPIHYFIGSLILGGTGFLVYRKFFRRMISPNGLEFITEAEGFKIKAYKDVRGLDTIGVGHLIVMPQDKALLTKTLTKKEVTKIFDKDLDRFEAVVKNTIKVPLKDYQRDALISFAFNIGTFGFQNSGVAKAINRKASESEIIKAFSQWKSPSKIIPRRAKEARLFLTGNYNPSISETEVKKYIV